MINGAIGGLPVTYEKKTAPKERIDKDNLWKSDVRTFDNKIGFLTNLSSTMFSMISKYKETDPEYKILENRLKICTVLQSQVIDMGKGIEVMGIPKFWTNWNKWEDGDVIKEIELKKSHNKLLVEQRPYFMTFTYPQKAKKYREHLKMYDDYSRCFFAMGLKELIKENDIENPDKKKCLDFFFRYSPISDDPSIMNKVSHFMESKVKVNRVYKSDFGWEFDVDKIKLELMKELYKEWDSKRKYNTDEHDADNKKYRNLADNISANSKETAKLALMTNRRFANSIFGEDILELFYRKNIEIPVLDKNGDKYFSGNKYKIISFSLEE